MEDVNAEHLLDVFTSIDANSDTVWDVCFHFLEHLVWYKVRQTVLRPKIEALPDGHHSKPKCLFKLSRLFQRVGNWEESRRLLTHTLQLERRSGDSCRVAETLRLLCTTNRLLGRYDEGIQQAKEALGIYERLHDTTGQANCWNKLAFTLIADGQSEAAEDAAFRAINLASETGQESLVCESHQALGRIYRYTGEAEKAVRHLQTGLEIASTFNRHDLLFDLRYSLVLVWLYQGRLNDASSHIEQAKLHVADNLYNLGKAMEMQAEIRYRQRRLEDAKSEALGAREIFRNLGAVWRAESCSDYLWRIEQATETHSTMFQN